MAEEEKKESTEVKDKPDTKDVKPQDDYQAKYQAQQAELQKLTEQLKSAQATLDTLDQYGAINWDKISGTKEAEEKPPEVDSQLKQQLQRQEGKVLMLQFRLDNPDLREYEDDLVAPFVIKARQRFPRETSDQILKRASDDVRAFLEKHEKQVLEKAKKAKVEADKENASGLETAGKTTPESEVDEEQSRQNYVDYRRKRRAKQIGVA